VERIRIQLVDAQLQDLFARLIARTSDLTPLMQRIEGHLRDQTEQAFEDEATPEAQPWPDLADSTKAVRAATGHWPGKMLQVSGQLAASFTGDHGRDYAVVGSNKAYAAVQLLGGQAGRGGATTIPARQVLGLGSETVDLILADARKMLDEAAAGR
jgi:phage virion morphogenesis protein